MLTHVNGICNLSQQLEPDNEKRDCVLMVQTFWGGSLTWIDSEV